MAKLDDLLVVLEEEVHSFSSSVAELKTFAEELKEPQLQRELQRIRILIEDKQEQQNRRLEREFQELRELKRQFQKSQLIPRWILVLYGLVLVLCLLFFMVGLVS